MDLRATAATWGFVPRIFAPERCAGDPQSLAGGSSMVAPPCFIYYDRHVEKNAGSTMRVLMKRLEEHGECAYWGYFQSDQAWSTAMALRHFTQSVAPPRLCVEAHTGVDASARLVQLSGLKRALQERGSSCRVLRSLRIRDPVWHYQTLTPALTLPLRLTLPIPLTLTLARCRTTSPSSRGG